MARPNKPYKLTNTQAVSRGRKGGIKGGPARARALAPKERIEIAKMGKAAQVKGLTKPNPKKKRPRKDKPLKRKVK